VADDHLFLRGDADNGVQDYKSTKRAEIETTFRVQIIANVGDQQSDLDGGYAERTFKVPNPFYFIRPQ
jgi:putative acid phosphatase of HAD superfamily subfamily IIIB